MAEKLAKTGPQTTFAAKIGSEGSILATETGPPCQFWSPCEMYDCNNLAIVNQLVECLAAHSYSYKWLNSDI